jgi:hypothetical protein
VEHECGHDHCFRALHLHRLLHAVPLQDAAISRPGAEYHPYTAYHIFETLQILLFTGLGFFLLLKKLVPEPTISLDMDWFYRKGWRVSFGSPASRFNSWIPGSANFTAWPGSSRSC